MAEEDVSVKFGAETSKFNSAVSDLDDKIDGFFAQLDKSSGQMKAFGDRLDQIQAKFTSGKTGIAEYASQVERLGKSFGLSDVAKKTEEGFNSLSLSTVGAKREVVVLAHEMVSGNLSRVPGSLMVLAERMGGLSMATMGVGAALGLAAYGAYEWFEATQKAERSTNELNVKLQAFNSSYLTEEIKTIADEFGRLPNVSEEAATKVASGFAMMNGAGGKSLRELTELTRNFSAVFTNGDMGKGFTLLSKALENPEHGVKELAQAFHGQLDQALVNDAIELAKNGDQLGAQAKLIDALNERLKDAADNGLTEFTKKWNDLKNMMKDDWSMRNVASSLTFGMSDMVAPKPKQEKTEGQKQDESEVKAALDAQFRYNQEMQRANDLARSVKSEETQRAAIVEKIAYFTAEANKAKGHGDESSFKNLSQAAEAYREKLNKIDEAKARAAEREQREAERAARQTAQAQDVEIQGVHRVENEKLRTSEEMVRLMVASKQMGLSEEYAALKDIRDREYAQEQSTFEKRRALWARGSEEWNRINADMSLSYEKYQQDLMKLDEKRIRDQEQQNQKMQKDQDKYARSASKVWEKAGDTIHNSMMSMIEGTLRGTQSLSDGFKKMAGNMVIYMIDALLQIGEKWIATQLLEMITGKATMASIVSGHAGEAYAAAFASTAAIPIIGPSIAPGIAAAAASQALAGGLAFGSFEVGTNYVPKNMKAQIHEGERIVPKADNAKLMKAVENGTEGGGQVHLHVHALDSRDVKRFLSKNRESISKQVQSYARGGGRIPYAGG